MREGAALRFKEYLKDFAADNNRQLLNPHVRVINGDFILNDFGRSGNVDSLKRSS